MTDKQSGALRIADLLSKEIHRTVYVDVLHQDAINELLRLHEVSVMLFDALHEMVEAYQYEASSENPSLLNARIAIAKAQGDNNGTN